MGHALCTRHTLLQVAFPYSISAASISVYDTATKVTTPLANA